ncbi:NAD(P)/FAD-dependent oxidoreductase [Desertibaculum subflavum]|uniref:NAD(P)/FAD-dependent oxidoreductase n=1 Tax=Desertibaculum subflavum TaxID=2268458 RepID=UPI000E66FF17
MHDILIIGGGYAGLWAAFGAARQLDLAGREAEIALVTREPYLTARPRLYERDLAPGEARLPLAPMLQTIGAELVVGEVTGIDAPARRVTLADGRSLTARVIVLAAGSRAALPAIPGLAEHAEGIDDADQSARLWRRLAAFEGKAPAVAVIGGGFTGIELATELAGWRDAKAPGARIVLIDQGPIAAGYAGAARGVIGDALSSLGVRTRAGSAVAAVEAGGLRFADGDRLGCDVAVWTGGLEPSPLNRLIDAPKNAIGRLKVDAALRVDGLDGWLAAGDVAAAGVEGGNSTTMSCQHALSSGAFAGNNAARLLLGEAPLAYTPRPYVTCLDLGPAGALLTRGFEREVAMRGAEAKALKTSINRQLIVPPVEGGRAALLAAAAPERWMTR